MNKIRLLSTMGLAGVMQVFGPEFETAHDLKLEADFLPTVRLIDKIHGGDRGDVAILTGEAVDELVAGGVLDSRTDLARSFVGVAVKAGAPHPDISTPEAFVATLLGARGVAMSQAGASGIFMAGLLERLGIADAVRAKATILASGFTAELAANGQVDIAIQQVSELQVVQGVEIVGRLPAALGGITMFSAGLFRHGEAGRAKAGRELIAALASPDRDALYRRCGLEPAGTTGSAQA